MTVETGDSRPDMASLEAGGADLRQEENLRRENEESKGAKQRKCSKCKGSSWSPW